MRVPKILKTLTGRMLAGIDRDVPITGEAYSRADIAGLSPAVHVDNWKFLQFPYRGSFAEPPLSSSLPDCENSRTEDEVHIDMGLIPIMCGESRLPCDYREVGIASRVRPLKSVLTSTEPVGRDGKYVQLKLFDHQSEEDVK